MQPDLLVMANPEEMLRETLKEIAKEKYDENCSIIVKAVSSGGANYTSFLYNATLQAGDKEDLEVFAKVAAIGEKSREKSIVRIYETESFFYNKLLKKYKQLEEKNKVPAGHRYKTPVFYGGSDEIFKEMVIMENLTTKGYTVHDRFKSIDWEYASKSLETIAKLHALSIALSEEDPEGFEEVCVLNANRNFEITNFLDQVAKNALKVIKEENRDRFLKFTDKHKDFEKFFQHRRRRVIIHGDYRPSNLMHRVIDGNVDIVVVDYQTLQIGNPLIDVMYFIFNSTDKNFRDKYFKASLEHYYEELRKALKRLNCNPDELYSREDFDFELKEILPAGLMVSMFSLLVITVEKEDAPEVKHDLTFDDFVVNPNTLYAERINDIMDDFIKMRVI